MLVDAPAPPRGRLASAGTGVALAGAAAYVVANDPSAPGARFVPCPLHAATGWWCPLCGLTRGTHELLTGHPLAALGYNVLTPVVLVAIVTAWWLWLRAAWVQPTRSLVERVSPRAAAVIALVLVVFAVARNLPVPGLRALAP